MSRDGKRVTIKDVAKLAGVSPSTVSFVLNKSKGQSISEETKKRIRQSVEQLGYRPNYYASNIRKGKSKTIGVVTTYRVNYIYFLDLINGVIEEANEHGYGVVICPRPENRDDVGDSFLTYYQEGRIDGVVFISSAHSEEKSHECDYISIFRKHNIPFSVIYGYTDFPGVCYAHTNFYEDGRRACELLLKRGCKRVTYIGALDKDNRSLYMPQTERDRMEGYIGAMQAAGLPHEIIHLPRDFHINDYDALVRDIADNETDGYVTNWATYGLQLLTVLKDAGKRVPDDVRVVALDSLPYLNHTSPPLTAMRMPFYEMARFGTEMLIGQLKDKGFVPMSKRFDATLEMRTSTE